MSAGFLRARGDSLVLELQVVVNCPEWALAQNSLLSKSSEHSNC